MSKGLLNQITHLAPVAGLVSTPVVVPPARLTVAPFTMDEVVAAGESINNVVANSELDALEEVVLDLSESIGFSAKHAKAILALIRHSKERNNLYLADVDRVLVSLRK